MGGDLNRDADWKLSVVSGSDGTRALLKMTLYWRRSFQVASCL
jgi:hypothetical protein